MNKFKYILEFSIYATNEYSDHLNQLFQLRGYLALIHLMIIVNQIKEHGILS